MTPATPHWLARRRTASTGIRPYRSLHALVFALALFTPGVARAQQPLFTFVQISDSQPTDSDDQLMFELVLDTIVDAGSPGALMPYPIDYVVFAGDLVDSGTNTSEWNVFVQTMNAWLTANGIPYRAVPGNHDRSTNFGNYNTFIGSPATWSMSNETFVGHNGLQVNTGWRGLRYIGINNTNGANNVISAADLAAVNVFVPAAVAANENIFLLQHHPHNESGRMPLAGILNTPEIVAYMRGHTNSPGIVKGLLDVSNPNIWDTRSNAIYQDGAILYFEVFQNDLEAHVIELVDNPSQLPAPQIIHLVHGLVSSGGPTTTMPPGSTTTMPGTTTTTILPPSGSIVLGQVRTGGSVSTNTVSTSLSLTAVSGDLYLAAVSTKGNTSVVGVSGLGLTWSPVVTRCSGRNQTGVSIWKSQGTPTVSGTVTATLGASVSAATIAVARYSGVAWPVAFDDVESANTNGIAGACSGGTDSAAYSLGVTSFASNSLVFGAAGMRNRQHIPGAGYTQQASVMSSSGGTAASVAVFDRSFTSPSTITVNGSFDGSVDWAVAAVVIPGADEPAFCSSNADCNDGNECTADSCDGSGTCVWTNLSAGSTCTSDGNSCTNDQCNGAGACVHPANAAPCNDGLFCNGADTCSGGTCSVHAGDPCSGGPVCAQTCSEAADTCNAPAGSPCDDGNECTANQCNGSGVCTATALPATTACTSDGNLCTDDRCNGAGACAHPANAAPCEDGVFCNGAETCAATVCQPGTPPALDDGVACTDDSCDEANDVILHAPNNGACSDGTFCNGVETCNALSGCQAGADPCVGASCDETTDQCVDCLVDGDCDDGTFCNGAETCVATVCQAGTPPTLDDGIACTADSCDESNDVVVHAPNEASCDDGTFCNGVETCDATLGCQAGTPPTLDDGIQCTADSCDEANDVVLHAPNEASCDDGTFCNGSETCDVLLGCQAGTPPTIDDGVACTDDSCDETNDVVTHAPNDASCDDGTFCNGAETCDVLLGCQAGTDLCVGSACDETTDQCVDCLVDGDCDDGAFCNGAETCVATVCQAGAPPTLDDGVACTDDSCDETNDVVTHAPNDASCDDGTFCNGSETCDVLLGCQAGADPCVGASCDETANQCVDCLVDGDCDDGAFCNGAETCVATICQPGTPPALDDGVACTVDSCDEINDVVVHAPNAASCDDGTFCNGAETCDVLLDCQAGTPPTIDDGVACTDDSCDETSDVVTHAPNDASCDDGTFCNGSETCDVLLGCQAGNSPTLDDGVACTDDSCDETNDVVTHAPNDASCDDGTFCNGAETCDVLLGCQAGADPCVGASCDEASDQCVDCLVDGDCDDGTFCNGAETCVATVCQAGTPPTLDDGVACTDDSCDETNDVVTHAPNDVSCDDGTFCNGAETCDVLLGCQAGAPPTLDDGVACTADSCDETNDVVVHAPNDASCDDGTFCNGAEICDVLLGCQSGADPCVGASCDETADRCVDCLVDGDCDDGTFCNGAETCVATVCLPGTPIVCSDSVSCTVDACNETTDDCDNTPSNALCDDGTFCNGAETCNALSGCQAGTPPTLDDGIACTADSCDEINDLVLHAPSDVFCDDGTFCNGAETCNTLSGCQAGAAPTINDGVPCTDDSCDEANDVVVHAPNDALCNDSAFCNGAETCNALSGCQAGTAVDCNDGVSCTVDGCNETTDDCDNTPNNGLCGDGLFCNGTETCNATLGCQAGTPVNCDDADVCTTDSCNETNDICDHVDTCEPPAPVTAEEVRSGSSVNLSSVTTAQALSGIAGNLYLAAISYKPNMVVNSVTGLGLTWTRVGAQCAARVQTGIEVWRAQGSPSGSGVVTASLQGTASSAVIAVTRYSGVSTSNPVGSVESANSLGIDGPCTGGTDTASYSYSLPGVDTGAVVYSAVAMRNRTHTPGASYQELVEVVGGNGGQRSSEAVSQRTGAAAGTVLVNGTFSGNADWAGLAVEVRRDEISACSNDAQCSDGQFCNGVEACVAGGCQAGSPVNCSDGVTCTADSCNESTDSCTHILQDAACNDGLFCNGTESCTAGGCQAGTPVNCGDTVSCTVDTCNESTDSCVHTPDAAACSDGAFCNGVETCNATLGCQAGATPCPGLSCDESGDFCTCTDDGQCNDGQFCNGIESCVAGGCQAGTAVDCTDADACTTDSCDEANDTCQHLNTCNPPAPVTAEEVRTGSSVNLSSVTTDQALSGVAGNLYLAAISYKPNMVVSSVAGLGLTWTRVGAQCAARAQTGIEVWRAQGSPSGSGVVTATLQGAAPSSAVIVVTRYSGVSTSNPVGSVESANSLGIDGPCAGGIDAASYSYSLPGVDTGAVVYSAVAMRNRTHTPGAGYQELVEVLGSSGGSASSEAVSQRTGAAPGTVLVNGTFSGTIDWAGLAVEVLP